MRVLVTGSSGYIGSKLCQKLSYLPVEILTVDRKAGMTIDDCDYKNVDLIYHLAARADVQYSREHPLEDAMDNIIATIKLIQKYPDVRIIFPASAASLVINSPYGLSKKTAEDYIKLLCKDYVICRLANIWGDGGHGAVDNWLKADVIKINGDGSQMRTLTHVDDVVEGFIKAMNWPKGAYNLGGEGTTIKEMAIKVSIQTGKPIVYDLDYDTEKQGEVFSAVIPNTTPNWKPIKTL